MTLPDIDTVFLTTDPDNLFDEETGIYVFGEVGLIILGNPILELTFGRIGSDLFIFLTTKAKQVRLKRNLMEA